MLTTLIATVVLAASDPALTKPAPTPADFESHQVVLLVKGPKWTAEKTPESEKIMAGHLAHLTKMGAEGKMLVAGPFDSQSDESIRGMCIYKVASLADAVKLASQDPAVQAGRLKVVSLQWWTEKGYVAFPKAPLVVKPPAK